MIGGGGINTKAIAAVSSWVIRNSSCIFFPDVDGSLSIVVFQDFSGFRPHRALNFVLGLKKTWLSTLETCGIKNHFCTFFR